MRGRRLARRLGYNVKVFTFHDSPVVPTRSLLGGINAAKNYRNDGDSVYRLFYDTVKGATTRPVKPTCTASPRCRSTSSTSARAGCAVRP